jgi:hypothetical protein
MIDKIKDNKSFQVIVGAFVCYAALRLYRAGWFDYFMSSEPTTGYGNAELILSIGGIVVNFLQLVGIASIGIVSGVLPELNKITEWISNYVNNFVSNYKAGKDKDDPAFDWRPLIVVIALWFFVSSGRAGFIWDRVLQVIGIENVIPEQTSRAVFFIGDDAEPDQLLLANSAKVGDMFDQSAIERRLYYAGQSLEASEEWVKNTIKKVDPTTSQLIFSTPDGRVSTMELPSRIEQYRKLTAK